MTSILDRAPVIPVIDLADAGPPCLPGVATVSEVLGLLERGISAMKFFPAAASGGRAYLNASH